MGDERSWSRLGWQSMCLSRGVSASSDCPAADGAPLSRHADQRQVMALKLVGVATHATPSFPEGCMVFRDADAAGPQWGRAGVNVPHAQAQSLSRHMRTLRQGGRHRALFPSQGDQPTCLVNRANRPTKDIQIRQTEGRGGPFQGPRHTTLLLPAILGARLRWLKA